MTGAATTLLIVKSIVKLIRPPSLTMPQLTPQRDSRALPASSTAIAGSAFYDTRDTSSDGAGVRGKDTGWQMAHTTDYRVRAADTTVIFTDRPARFRYSKERTIERGKSMMSPRVFVAILRTSAMTPRTSVMIPRTSVTMLGTPVTTPGTSW
jgi:hypothetical protein